MGTSNCASHVRIVRAGDGRSPIEFLPVHTPHKTGWMQSIADFESYFEPIPLTYDLATALEGQMTNLLRVHVVVTAVVKPPSIGACARCCDLVYRNCSFDLE